MMKTELLSVPHVINMGFHYTLQYSRRTRVNVMGLIDQSTDEWARWYLKTHALPALQAIADAGYTMLEIHFLYGYGLEGEREEWERTREMVGNAHAVGLKVLGYFQFHSVQQELFFLENPWAPECVQVAADGKRIQFRYDRPALCFTDPRVQQYYLAGVELGLKTCDLDGIRLDNDYFRGCYCPRCQNAFRAWLREKFPSAEVVRRVFGLPTTDGMSLVPVVAQNDPLWLAMVQFRMEQRQEIMRLISQKVRAIKPNAILGGNPALHRRVDDLWRTHVYPPDLGETHHLVCAENARFPARTGDTIRHQALLYKHGQSSHFAVFASHHLHDQKGQIRWPATFEECALSLCEALAFGGHPICTTWGIRMDGDENKYLYQRPIFRRALDPIVVFLKQHGDIYRGAVCDAVIGIYQNRESLIADAANAWLSLHGVVQILLQRQMPFRLVDRDRDELLDGLRLIIVPDMQLISDQQLARFRKFADAGGRVLFTGGSACFDAWRLKRDDAVLQSFFNHPNVVRIAGTPEKIARLSERDGSAQFAGDAAEAWQVDSPMPDGEPEFTAEVRKLAPPPAVTVTGSPFVALDTFVNASGEHFAHLLNYDNTAPCDLVISVAGASCAEVFMPDGLGAQKAAVICRPTGGVEIKLKKLHTYCVIKSK